MKSIKALLSAVILLSAVNMAATALADNDVIARDQFEPGSYCHEKFPAVAGRTLASDDPALKNVDSGDLIDFYGPCSENPVGKDQIQAQELDREHRWEKNYAD